MEVFGSGIPTTIEDLRASAKQSFSYREGGTRLW